MGLLPMGAEILPPTDERIFKLILTTAVSKPILLDLLSAILGVQVVDAAAKNCEIPDETVLENAERLDINCLIFERRQFYQADIELHFSRIQEDPGGAHEKLKGDSTSYLCGSHASRSAACAERYDRPPRTFQLTLCSYTVFPERASFVNSFSLRHDEDSELLTDALQVVIVELSKLEEIVKKPVCDMTDLEKWAVFLRYADAPEYRETVNRVIESKAALQMAGERLVRVSRDEREQAVSRSRRKAEADLKASLAAAWDSGKSAGEVSKAISAAQLMAAAGEPDDKIMRYTGLPIDEIKKLRN